MGKKSRLGKGLLIVALIMGASGLILGGYSFIQIQTGNTGTEIVGLWESLTRDVSNPDFNLNDDWLVEVDDAQIINSNYLRLDQTPQHQNTRFHLLKSGWYRVDMIMLLWSLTDTFVYGLRVYKNGVDILHAEYFRNADVNQIVSSNFYISSDGNDYYEINGWSFSGDSFDISSTQKFNQLTITYIGVY